MSLYHCLFPIFVILYTTTILRYNNNIYIIYSFSIKPTRGVLQILPSDWLSYSLSIGDRPLVAKGIDFQIQNNGR